MNGLIVSIQNYTKSTTQELARIAIANGAVCIRTDQAIKCKVPIIGLKKLFEKEFYITTDNEAIQEVSKWADCVAVDSRRGNREIEWLYAVCHTSNINLVADIEKIEDVENVLKICENNMIKKPKYFATTFSKCDIDLIKAIRKITDVKVIAEGGFGTLESVTMAKENGAVGVCIGAALEMGNLCNIYRGIWNG